jgi:hypothetical protein
MAAIIEILLALLTICACLLAAPVATLSVIVCVAVVGIAKAIKIALSDEP